MKRYSFHRISNGLLLAHRRSDIGLFKALTVSFLMAYFLDRSRVTTYIATQQMAALTGNHCFHLRTRRASRHFFLVATVCLTAQKNYWPEFNVTWYEYALWWILWLNFDDICPSSLMLEVISYFFDKEIAHNLKTIGLMATLWCNFTRKYVLVGSQSQSLIKLGVFDLWPLTLSANSGS